MTNPLQETLDRIREKVFKIVAERLEQDMLDTALRLSYNDWMTKMKPETYFGCVTMVVCDLLYDIDEEETRERSCLTPKQFENLRGSTHEKQMKEKFVGIFQKLSEPTSWRDHTEDKFMQNLLARRSQRLATGESRHVQKANADWFERAVPTEKTAPAQVNLTIQSANLIEAQAIEKRLNAMADPDIIDVEAEVVQ